jgi:argininosuccinate lyase
VARRRAKRRVTLWSHRMSAEPDPSMMAFTESLSFDRRLSFDDLEGSRAHVRGLGRSGILNEQEVADLLDALETVRREFADGGFEYRGEDEDIHTAIERRVTEIAGETGAKLHTGRSRNDQVATALRLYTRRHLRETSLAVLELCETLLRRAQDAKEAWVPGYTHLQRAQRIPLGLQLLAHGWSLLRDVDRLGATARRLDVSPLGAGALAGSSLPLDHEGVAHDLGFSRAFVNSIDAVSDRDFVAETLFDLALLGVHLSRLGEEIVIYSSSEFGFYLLDEAWATGSSMLPQKMNPDVAELARGKSGRLIGHLTGLMTTLKGIPFAYNRDLQEDKEPLFDSFDQIGLALRAIRGVVGTLRFDEARMREASSDPNLRAVELAEWLVARGMPFRGAHSAVAELVRRATGEHRPISELVADEPDFGPEAVKLFRSESPQTNTVKAQLELFQQSVASERAGIEGNGTSG